MSLKIEFDMSEVLQLEAFLTQFKDSVVVQSARRAINRTVQGVRQKSVDDIRKRLNVKEKDLRKRMRFSNAKGATLKELEGNVSYSETSLPMMLFVKGSKQVIQQKGIAVKKRRKLKFEVAKGKTFTAQSSFIQKNKRKKSNGGTETFGAQVFRGRRGEGFKKQAIASIGAMVSKRGLGERFQAYAGERFQKEFARELNIRAKGIVNTRIVGTKGRGRPKGA